MRAKLSPNSFPSADINLGDSRLLSLLYALLLLIGIFALAEVLFRILSK